MIRVIDSETSGEDPNVDIVEVGWCDIVGSSETGYDLKDPDLQDEDPLPWTSFLANPGRAITPQSSAVHHIINADVQSALSPGDVLRMAFDCPPETIFVAHYADSEFAAFGGKRGFDWIDTWKIAVVLAPKAPSWGLQQLRYWINLDLDRRFAEPAHRAGPDAYVCAALLLRMLAKMSPEDMVKISAGPVFLPRFSFGKHAGLPIEEVPVGYLDWILKQRKEDGSFDFDKNVVFTAMTEIDRRQRNPRG